MILGVYFSHKFDIDIWFRTETKEKVRYIPLHEISANLGQELTATLLAFHAIAGCYSTSCFKGRNKKRSLLALKSSTEEFQSLRNLGDQFPLRAELIDTCERFTCRLYQPNSDINDINILRYKIFCKKPQQNQRLPPCQESLIQLAFTPCYRCAIWKSALIPKPHLPSPVGNEWEVKEDEGLTLVLAEQSAAPMDVLELTVCRCRASKCSRRNCECIANGLNWTSACTCEADRELCENELNNQDSSDSYSNDTTDEEGI